MKKFLLLQIIFNCNFIFSVNKIENFNNDEWESLNNSINELIFDSKNQKNINIENSNLNISNNVKKIPNSEFNSENSTKESIKKLDITTYNWDNELRRQSKKQSIIDKGIDKGIVQRQINNQNLFSKIEFLKGDYSELLFEDLKSGTAYIAINFFKKNDKNIYLKSIYDFIEPINETIISNFYEKVKRKLTLELGDIIKIEKGEKEKKHI